MAKINIISPFKGKKVSQVKTNRSVMYSSQSVQSTQASIEATQTSTQSTQNTSTTDMDSILFDDEMDSVLEQYMETTQAWDNFYFLSVWKTVCCNPEDSIRGGGRWATLWKLIIWVYSVYIFCIRILVCIFKNHTEFFSISLY